MKNFTWLNQQPISGYKYECGYCSTSTSPSIGWFTKARNNDQGFIFVCNHCNNPSFAFVKSSTYAIQSITPQAMIGREVDNLPEDVDKLYTEIRKSTSAGANTAAVLACRKLLMHIAVQKGAKEGKSFISYVDFLADQGFVPPDGRTWVDYIRDKGNEANHEIVITTQSETKKLITFVEMLLRFVYEFKSLLPKEKPPEPEDE